MILEKYKTYIGWGLLTVYILFTSCASFYYIGSEMFAPEEKDFKSGIQNHLVWTIRNECHFVKPITRDYVRLIRVEDCDKK